VYINYTEVFINYTEVFINYTEVYISYTEVLVLCNVMYGSPAGSLWGFYTLQYNRELLTTVCISLYNIECCCILSQWCGYAVAGDVQEVFVQQDGEVTTSLQCQVC
jgi:hypothetical protein